MSAERVRAAIGDRHVLRIPFFSSERPDYDRYVAEAFGSDALFSMLCALDVKSGFGTKGQIHNVYIHARLACHYAAKHLERMEAQRVGMSDVTQALADAGLCCYQIGEPDPRD